MICFIIFARLLKQIQEMSRSSFLCLFGRLAFLQQGGRCIMGNNGFTAFERAVQERQRCSNYLRMIKNLFGTTGLRSLPPETREAPDGR